MENEPILELKPKCGFSSLTYIKAFNACYACFLIIPFLVFILIMIIENDSIIMYIDSFFDLIFNNIIISIIFFLGFFIVIPYFIANYAGRKAVERITYRIYPDFVEIDAGKHKKKLDIKDIKNIMLYKINPLGKSNIGNIKFIKKSGFIAYLKDDFSFYDIEEPTAVYNKIQQIINDAQNDIKESYIDNNKIEQSDYTENQNLIMTITPKNITSGIKAGILTVIALLAILDIIYFCTFYFQGEDIKTTFYYIGIIDIILLLGIIITYIYMAKNKSIINTKIIYKIYTDRIVFELNLLNSYQNSILSIADIVDVKYKQTSVQQQNNVGTVYFILKKNDSNNSLEKSFNNLYNTMANVENPAYVCAKIKELIEQQNQNNT